MIGLAFWFYIGCAGSKHPAGKNGDDKDGTASPASPGDTKIILKINNQTYTNRDFRNYLRINYPNLESTKSQYTNTSRFMSRLFDSFVEHKILSYAAAQQHIPASEDEIDKLLAKLQIPKDRIDKNAISDAVKVQKLLYYKAYENTEVSEKEIQDYYRNNINQFRKQSEVHLFQILVKDRDTAERIRGILANNPEKFSELAKKESQSKMEADKGGDMGFFEKGTLPKDMEDVVFALSPNTISPVIQSTYGFHIFKVESKKKERLLYIDKVKPDIQNILMTEKIRDAYQKFLSTTKQNLNLTVEYNQLNFNYQKNENDEGDSK